MHERWNILKSSIPNGQKLHTHTRIQKKTTKKRKQTSGSIKRVNLTI